MIKLVKDFLNGIALGIVEIIPGVSGGTIAIILGFYFELIETINHFTKNIRKNLRFAIPLLLGMITGIILFSSLIKFLLNNYSFPTMLFFIGLITGIIPHIYKKTKEEHRLKLTNIVLIAAPFILLIVLSFIKKEASVSNYEEIINNIGIPYMIFIFIAGILAATALIIPGISGSFVLLLLGIYPLAIYSISSLGTLLSDFSNTALIFNILKVMAPLAVGIIIGVLLMARLIENLLKNYQSVIYSLILGLLSGSVFFLFREPMVYSSGLSAVIVIIGAVTFLVGAVLSFLIGKKRL
jgi:putative membrane protein